MILLLVCKSFFIRQPYWKWLYIQNFSFFWNGCVYNICEKSQQLKHNLKEIVLDNVLNTFIIYLYITTFMKYSIPSLATKNVWQFHITTCKPFSILCSLSTINKMLYGIEGSKKCRLRFLNENSDHRYFKNVKGKDAVWKSATKQSIKHSS